MDVRNLCGLAQSNSFTPAASLIASMAIALCKSSFEPHSRVVWSICLLDY